MATLLSISDFTETELWNVLDIIPVLPGGGNLTDYDGDDVNNYLLEGDRHFRRLAEEFGVDEADWTSPITEKMKCKLVSWVSYCIMRDQQEGLAIPLYNDIQENRIEWFKQKKEDYLLNLVFLYRP